MILTGFGTTSTRGELKEILSKARDILRYYETLFGPCPYQRFSIVFGEGTKPGGHSPPGMSIISRRSIRLRRMARSDPADFSDVEDFFLAHELAHQWWGHGVAPENYRERWISEAFAQYAAALWIRQVSGERDFLRILARMDKWAIRRTEQGPIRLGYRLGHIRGDSKIFRAIVYNKGASVLHMLSSIVGDDVFFEALRALQENRRFQRVGADDIRQILETKTKQDLGDYFAAWIYGTSLPRLRLSYNRMREGPSYLTSVRVEAEDLPGAVPLTVSLKMPRGSAQIFKEMLAPNGGSWTYRTEERPRKVELNEDRRLLAIIKK
jgi:aminopeptidase N